MLKKKSSAALLETRKLSPDLCALCFQNLVRNRDVDFKVAYLAAYRVQPLNVCMDVYNISL